MKNQKENIVHEVGKYVADELVTKGANGNFYTIYQKRLFGAEAGG